MTLRSKIEICDRCKKEFERKWNGARKDWSQINDIHYWTDGKNWKDYRLVCKPCLNYWFEEDWGSFNELVSPEKRGMFRSYRYIKTL